LKVCWISAGVSSFISGWLIRDEVDEFIYTHIDDQHKDSLRFLVDCEKALGKKITVLQSMYKTVDEVVRQFRFINSAYGAKCTQVLKKRVRKVWENQNPGLHTYVWGFDCGERGRVDRLLESMPEYLHVFPLIENNLAKEDCHGILKQLGIKRPVMYDLGYRNNNCVGCVKGGMGYWNKIRVDFPEVFERRARMERRIGRTCIKGIYLDELDPNRGIFKDEVLEECSIMCQIYGA